MIRAFIAASFVSISTAGMADVTAFPISIPQECMELADREGVPAFIENRFQASKAKVKLAQLSASDPMVRKCRAAVERRRQAAR